MWADVQKHVEENLSSDGTPPFSAMDLTNRIPIEEDVQTIASEPSKRTMQTLPSYQGEYECRSFTKYIPFYEEITIH